MKALFISTVRSDTTQLEFDQQYDMGFVGNVKRFNTALSRAVALIVIVGDTVVLSQARAVMAILSSRCSSCCSPLAGCSRSQIRGFPPRAPAPRATSPVVSSSGEGVE